MDRAIISVFGVKTEKFEMRLARADPGIQKDRGDMKLPLQLTFNGANPEVGMQRLQVGDKQERVVVPF